MCDILCGYEFSVCLYGSAVLDDFRPGWSDIDILVLTDRRLSEAVADRLVGLRGELSRLEPANQYYRRVEGGILSLDAFMNKQVDRVVYWGTSGERICDRYSLDSFCRTELIENGLLLYGREIRDRLQKPTFNELYADVTRHYNTIRKYARTTGRGIYSFGWLFDIARCIYTLRYGCVIAKTAAAEWALENSLCPDPDILRFALEVRKNPLGHMNEQTFDKSERLGEPIQRFADILGLELTVHEMDRRLNNIYNFDLHYTD